MKYRRFLPFALSMFVLCSVEAASAEGGGTLETREPASPGLHARLFESHLQPLSEVCAGQEQDISCINDFWDVADVSGDGELSIAEITRILRIIAGKLAHDHYLRSHAEFRASTVSEADELSPVSEESAAVVLMASVGPVISVAAIANLDYDSNGLLSKREVLHDVAADILLNSVDTLPSEVRSSASKAVQYLLEFLLKK